MLKLIVHIHILFLDILKEYFCSEIILSQEKILEKCTGYVEGQWRPKISKKISNTKKEKWLIKKNSWLRYDDLKMLNFRVFPDFQNLSSWEFYLFEVFRKVKTNSCVVDHGVFSHLKGNWLFSSRLFYLRPYVSFISCCWFLFVWLFVFF